jgi:3-deoxy-manno-octulosonate cytidylyltransferase (CMP-KDO synthetase)
VSFVFEVVIPARYAASRLPGKPLLEIGNCTLINHVYKAACNSQADAVIIATDDERIEDTATSFGAEVMMTASEHRSGTDRIAEVVTRKNFKDDMIVVNVQGDEYALPPELINQVASALNENPDKAMATLCEKIEKASEIENPHMVKVVSDNNNNAIYFSRTAIPWQENRAKLNDPRMPVSRHIGIYAYRVGFLKHFSKLPECSLEKTEKLEQLRAIYNGYTIHVEEACTQSGMGIDTEEDLELARRHYAKQN